MPAQLEARPLPEHPGVTAYQITGLSEADVRREIDALFAKPGTYQAEFRSPRRVGTEWQARGYVRWAQ